MNNTSKNENGNRQSGRFDWLFSDVTISTVLLVTVVPAVVHGLLSLNSLPIAI